MPDCDCFWHYVRNYIICCCVGGVKYDPTVYEKDHPRYLSCFGMVHVKKSAIILAVFKILILLSILLYKFWTSNDELLRLFGMFGFIAVSLSNILVIAGVHAKKYLLLIPYFAACLLFIFILVLQLFYSFLDTANTKNSLEMTSLVWNLSLLAITIFEVYTLTVVWRAFVYICDYNMECRLERSQKLIIPRYSTESADFDQHLSKSVGTVNRITIGNDSASDSSDGE